MNELLWRLAAATGKRDPDAGGYVDLYGRQVERSRQGSVEANRDGVGLGPLLEVFADDHELVSG